MYNMKSHYLLFTYDKLFQEVKNNDNVNKEILINGIIKATSESFLCYNIEYTIAKKERQYKVNPPLHNLHPLATRLTQTLQVIDQIWLKEMNIIALQLGIPFTQLKYFNPSEEGKKYFYVTADVALEALAYDHLFFLRISNTLKRENQEIINKIKEQIFKLKSSKAVEQFLYKKQAAIESLKNRIIKKINPTTSTDLFVIAEINDKTNALRSMFHYLEKLSRFIEKDYSKFLNPNTTITFRTLISDEHKNIPKINTIKNFLVKLDIDLALLKIITTPLSKMTTHNIHEKMTIYEYQYLSKFIEVTYLEVFKRNTLTTQSEIEDWLLYYNFNAPEFLAYLQYNMILNSANSVNNSESLDKVNVLIKKYQQQTSKTDLRLCAKLATTRISMIKWLEVERNYLLNKMISVPNTATSDNEKGKLHTDLSVAQISYFFGLLLQSGIIKNQNQREIFRFIADNFKTNITDKISVQSISTKFYNIEDTTKKCIREKLNQMLNLTKSILFILTIVEDLFVIFD